MDGQYKKEQSSPTMKILVIVFGAVDVLLAAVLVLCFVFTSSGGSSLKADLSADFKENAKEYWESKDTAEYSSSVVFSYGSEGTVAPSAETGTDENSMYAGFVFPNSDVVALSDSEIQSKVTSYEVCRRAVNEIYARHGYAFTKQENVDYFNHYDWYRNMAKETDMSIVSSRFSVTEKQNVEKLQAYEKSQGWS